MHAKRCSIIFIPKNIYISKRQALEHGHGELARGRGGHAPFFSENFIIFTSSPPTQIHRKNCPFAKKNLPFFIYGCQDFFFTKWPPMENFLILPLIENRKTKQKSSFLLLSFKCTICGMFVGPMPCGFGISNSLDILAHQSGLSVYFYCLFCSLRLKIIFIKLQDLSYGHDLFIKPVSHLNKLHAKALYGDPGQGQ